MRIKLFLQKAWGGFKAHFVEGAVVVTAAIMLFGLALIASAMLNLAANVREIHKKAETAEAEATEAKRAQKTLLENSELNRKQWALLEQHNPEIAVPQVVGTDIGASPTPEEEKPRETPHIIIADKKAPRPTPTPRVEYRTKTRTKVKRVPVTPKPFWEYFRKDPKRTR